MTLLQDCDAFRAGPAATQKSLLYVCRIYERCRGEIVLGNIEGDEAVIICGYIFRVKATA